MAVRARAVEDLGVSSSFWHAKRVLLTGHTGFKGGWLTLWLESLGAKVTGLALAPAGKSFFEAVGLERAVRSLIGDIRQFEVVERAMREADPEIVFHLAAQPLVRASYADPVGNYATNVMGSVHVLEAVRRSPGVRAVVVVTTDKCYENREWIWGYRESDALGGHDPYSSSKACAEIVAAAYRKSYFSGAQVDAPAIATARAGNVIGGGDWADDRLIPDTVRAIAAGSGPAIRNPAAVRPWQHVLEPLRGYLMLAERLAGERRTEFAGAWNFGPDASDARSVAWVAQQFLAVWGAPAGWRPDAGAQPHETNFLKLDSSKSRHLLGWHPALDIGQALRDTASWYQAQAAGKDMRDLSLSQIAAYTKLVGQRARQEEGALPG